MSTLTDEQHQKLKELNHAALIEEIRSIFYQRFKGQPNMITPEILEYGEVKGRDLVYEVSKGKGIFTPDPLFGLTVLTTAGGTTSYNQVFNTRLEVQEHLNTLTPH